MIALLLVVALLLPSLIARKGWGLVYLGTWNIGPGDHDDLLKVMGRCSMLFLQEASDQVAMIYRTASHKGWKVITGNQAGQAATPLIYDRSVWELQRTSRLLLVHRQGVGPGAGPDTIKEKWLIGGLFRHRFTGRFMWAYSVHYVATQGKRKRRLVALSTSHRILLRLRQLARLCVIGGDFNNLEDSAPMDVITEGERVGMTEPIHTHGNRAIDRIIFTLKNWFRLIGTEPVETTSDHRAVIGEFEMRKRRRYQPA